MTPRHRNDGPGGCIPWEEHEALKDEQDVAVVGGFFWLDRDAEGAGITTLHPDATVRISNCAFMARPRWWHLRRWWHVFQTLRVLVPRNHGASVYFDGVQRATFGATAPEHPEIITGDGAFGDPEPRGCA